MTTLLTMNASATVDESSADSSAAKCTVMQITWSLVAGGAETYAMTIALGLERPRYRALMCAIDQGGALEDEIRRRQVPVFVMNRRQGIDWMLMWKMYRLFRREKVDVIHTHHFAQLFYSLPAAKLLGIRVIHTEHSVEAYKKPRLRWAMKLMSHFCHKVTAIGADGEKTLRDKVGISRKKLQVIHAAVDMQRFTQTRDAARAALDLHADDRVAVIVARLFPEKNHALLLEAFAQVVETLPDAKLLIVGDGILQEMIEQAIIERDLQQNVRLLGVRRDIPMILAASDVFVLCSTREGLPIAVLEAMAARLPVVATSVGDLPLVVHDGWTGSLVPSGDADKLAQSLTHLLSDPDLSTRMGMSGFGVVNETYSLQRMLDAHERLYAGQ